MKNKLSIILFIALSYNFIFAQEKTIIKDPFDISSIKKQIDELGIPTIESVQKLKDNAYSLFNSAQWETAAQALNTYSRNANWLANLIASGIEPYYDASYDDKQKIGYSTLKPLIPFEELANDYKEQRNEAMVMEAECYLKLGDNSKAVALLNNALDVINIQDGFLWKRARTNLYNLIGVKE